ncbi:MAG TPA: lytic transglycosylase domain-containing protein [Microvirga sp.]|jgi:soluble lytic murein transglycosylase-like protein|nr:lytic transglycosylase domain-containing protein [Microvirga sp.]
MNKKTIPLALAALVVSAPVAQADQFALYNLIDKHAAANDVPAELVHRVVKRESRYNPRAVGRGGAMGLMQIKHATARAMGYTGPASGLLDAETNLTYAVPYLAGAYKVARGNHNQAVAYYASGYYYAAKSMGLTKPTAATYASARAGKEIETTGAVAAVVEAKPAPAHPIINSDR